jgi:tRNA 2-selenouridine synthase
VSVQDGVPTLPASTALAIEGAVLVDLRSPVEFAADHIEGARNVPLLDDDERALVGLLYRRESPQAAFGAARERVRASVGRLVDSIARLAGWNPPRRDPAQVVDELSSAGMEAMDRRVRARSLDTAPARPVLLYCWRGGLRSRSVTALLRELGLERVVAIEGGYKSCRAQLLAQVESFEAPRTYVLRGLTGVGKTLVLRELEKLRPSWTLDLEAAAGHRSSLLGAAGLDPATQKQFENRIAQRVARGFGAGVLVLEGESRKVGDSIVPSRVWRALESGTNLELVAPTERRIDVLVADYLATASGRLQLRASLSELAQRISADWASELVTLLDSGRERELVALLLERWYDPRYRHSQQGRRPLASFDSTDPERCARDICHWIERDLSPAH